ncbi:TlpA disulfide reductase family protein [Vogesella sp. LIG4]|uniref:TlpA disulfide reductase family protein n=1 Tax=Vogesella sp. LIG4 TaxID=1192162 RepID=UPI00081F9F47|nr:TlpA disulfide reductase family protein [Vogesella sp. LIG4]SCK10543.1 Thiol-disulfide isomerase or thioredoxin [Vogesella sp. LIG4]
MTLHRQAATALLALLLPVLAHADTTLGTIPLNTPEGKPAQFSRLQGKLTVVNFWATWCAPCRVEMPMLSAEAKRLAARGVRFVGIALDQPQQVQGFLKQTPVSYPIVLADGDGIELMRNLGNKAGGLPFTVILNEHGQPVKQVLGVLDQKSLMQALPLH